MTAEAAPLGSNESRSFLGVAVADPVGVLFTFSGVVLLDSLGAVPPISAISSTCWSFPFSSLSGVNPEDTFFVEAIVILAMGSTATCSSCFGLVFFGFGGSFSSKVR